MSKSLTNVLDGLPWSVSGLIYDLEDVLDDEGRPIAERRANTDTRRSTEMDIRDCPYPGIRNGHLMNYSALDQVSRHFKPVAREIAAFRRTDPASQTTWSEILACVLDQLAGPAVYLLRQGDAQALIPAQTAVGHKLAAGYMGVMRTILRRLALGQQVPLSTESFLEIIDETHALVGASEACAGPPRMIEKASRILIEGSTEPLPPMDQSRIQAARLLAHQVELGVIWRLCDAFHYDSLLRMETRRHLHPCNIHLEQKLAREAERLDESPPPKPSASMLLGLRGNESSADLLAALEPQETDLAADIDACASRLDEPGSVVAYSGDKAAFAQQAAAYFFARRRFAAELSRLEDELRTVLGVTSRSPVRLGAMIFPESWAKPWYECILGQRLGEDGLLTGTTAGVRARTN